MSLVPLWDDSQFFRPSRLLDQHFGVGLGTNDLLQSLVNPRMLIQCPAGYLRNWRNTVQDLGSTVSFDKDKFQVNIDVQQFKPDEITVKITDDRSITVEGKHEEKQDEHGYISRHFIRKYVLPSNCDINQVQSNLSSDGVLTIIAPKAIEGKKTEEIVVPVIRTGQPSPTRREKTVINWI